MIFVVALRWYTKMSLSDFRTPLKVIKRHIWPYSPQHILKIHFHSTSKSTEIQQNCTPLQYQYSSLIANSFHASMKSATKLEQVRRRSSITASSINFLIVTAASY